MIARFFYIDVYSYVLQVVCSRKDRDGEVELRRVLEKDFSLPDDFIAETIENFNEGGWGGQYIFDASTRIACIEIHNCDKAWKVGEVLIHELDHIRGEIVKAHELEGPEASAYLAGFMGKKVIPLILRMK